MALKTPTVVLEEHLEDLKEEDFQKFCHRLVGRRGEPRVWRSRVENKSRVEVTEVMVSAFTEPEAVRVAAEILASIGCQDSARSLTQAVAEISSDSGSAEIPGDPRPPAAQQHFVDQNFLQLVKRVRNIPPILDKLLAAGLIKLGVYDKIRSIPTPQDQMRAIFSGPLQAGPRAKDIFCEILEEEEKYLMEDLKENN
ncbi:unnamed protein product [Ophioblennius macclurei]